jgi:hypothetical protein
MRGTPFLVVPEVSLAGMGSSRSQRSREDQGWPCVNFPALADLDVGRSQVGVGVGNLDLGGERKLLESLGERLKLSGASSGMGPKQLVVEGVGPNIGSGEQHMRLLEFNYSLYNNLDNFIILLTRRATQFVSVVPMRCVWLVRGWWEHLNSD